MEVFEITVEGEYVYGARGETLRGGYKEVFKLPFSGMKALSIIKKKLINHRLKKAENFRFTRLCSITKETVITGKEAKLLDKAKLKDFSLDEMVQFTAEQDMRIDVSKMGNIEMARRMIQEELVKPKAVVAKDVGKKSAKSKVPSQEPGDMSEFDELVE